MAEDPKHQTMRRNFNNLHIKRGILYRKSQDNEQEISQLVLPSVYRNQVLQGLHNDIGHPGKNKERVFS